MSENGIDHLDALRDHYGNPSDNAQRKQLDHLDGHCRTLIAASPFVVVGTSNARGEQDVSPRGDPPGFVKVLDDKHLLIPDRPGNRRLDSLSNLLENPGVGLLFMIPGMNETLRVNGRGRIVTDPETLAAMIVQEKPPLSALLVEVEAAYLHCGKALIRSRLWSPDAQVDRKSLPSLGKILADQIKGLEQREQEERLEKAYRETLY
ncbi:MAG TPA: pyridoxamine 5'-phosphate oxidase family protein [Kiloniellales bacterium]|jgi:PPOX class probable FMN-dependent enzyme|nr:pyridoxamine 5'-phosphate oxidase family protein [Kiloniellales bacterium]